MRLEIEAGHGAEAYLVSPRSPDAQAALRALQKAFDCEPVLLREGGSIPIVNEFKKILGADTLLLGLALPDDNAHSPNEKFDLDMFRQRPVDERAPVAGVGSSVGRVSRLFPTDVAPGAGRQIKRESLLRTAAAMYRRAPPAFQA